DVLQYSIKIGAYAINFMLGLVNTIDVNEYFVKSRMDQCFRFVHNMPVGTALCGKPFLFNNIPYESRKLWMKAGVSGTNETYLIKKK
ncbi:MAG: hypothetical protein AABY49_00165, partial [Planctomycetota bacterium]